MTYDDGNVAVLELEQESMTALPDEIFQKRRTKMRLKQALEAIHTFAEYAAVDAHFTAQAGMYELLAAVYRSLGKEALCAKCEARRDLYIDAARKLVKRRQAMGRKRIQTTQRLKAANQRASPYKRETPVEPGPVIRGDRSKNR